MNPAANKPGRDDPLPPNPIPLETLADREPVVPGALLLVSEEVVAAAAVEAAMPHAISVKKPGVSHLRTLPMADDAF